MTRIACQMMLVLLISVATANAADTVDSTHAGALGAISTDSTQFIGWPVRGVYEALAIHPAVVLRYPAAANETPNSTFDYIPGAIDVHVRGGELFENAFYLNGVHAIDPLTNRFSLVPANLALSYMDVYPSTRPAGRDRQNAGVIDIGTVAGQNRVHGTVEAVSDNVGGTGFDRNWYAGRLDGPIPVGNGGSFSAVMERRWFGDRDPRSNLDEGLTDDADRLPANWLGGWSGHGRIHLPLTDATEVTATGDYSREDYSRFVSPYLFNLEHSPYYESENLALHTRVTHDLSHAISVALGGSYFQNEFFSGDGFYREDILAYGRPNGNPRNDATNLLRQWDLPDTPPVFDTFYITTDTNVAGLATDSIKRLLPISGLEAHVWDDYQKTRASYFAVDGALTAHLHEEHSLTLGGEYRRYTLRSYRHIFPTTIWRGVAGGGFQDVSRYGYDFLGEESDTDDWRHDAKHPSIMSFYLHDQVEQHQAVLQFMLRADVFDYNALVPRNPSLPLDPDSLGVDSDPNNDQGRATLERDELIDSDAHFRLSTQVNAVARVAPWLTLRGYAGIHHEMPPLSIVYSDWDFFAYKVRTGGYYVAFGNAALEPIQTRQFGAAFTLTPRRWYFNLELYRKWSNNMPGAFSVSSFPTSFATLDNDEELDLIGLELSAARPISNRLNASVTYRFSRATGSSMFGTTSGNVAWSNLNEPKLTTPALSHDQAHRILAVFEAGLHSEEGPRLGSIHLLENSRLVALGRILSGFPFTPTTIVNEVTLGSISRDPVDLRNSRRMPWTWQIDLQAEKSFTLGPQELTLFLWVVNLLDRDNVNSVWPGSGEPNSTGWLGTSAGQDFINNPVISEPHDLTDLIAEEKYRLRENDPRNYQEPRQVYFGIRASF